MRGKLLEEVELRDGVGGIEALLKQESIKLQPVSASTVVALMNAEINDPFQQITSLYWAIAHAAIEGVLDQVRTALTQLVAELRANMPAGAALPSEEAADQAVGVVVTGKRAKVQVTTAQASGTSASASVTTAPPEPESGFWTRSRRIGAFIVGSAGVAAAVVAILEFVR